MHEPRGRTRKLLLQAVLGLALLPLLPSSCERRPKTAAITPPPPPTAPAPAPPSYMEQGDRAFESGDYAGAVSAYLDYLREEPNGDQRDRALYRMGLALALPENPSHDPTQAVAYLDQLTTDYPKSSLRPEAELIAALERDTLSLRAEIDQREQQLAAMNREMDGLKEQTGQVDQLRSDLKDREDRIHQLSVELEKLKAIDLQRRPAVPPAR